MCQNEEQGQSEASQEQAFWHGSVHCILGAMCENGLSWNERSVPIFSGSLYEAMRAPENASLVLNDERLNSRIILVISGLLIIYE